MKVASLINNLDVKAQIEDILDSYELFRQKNYNTHVQTHIRNMLIIKISSAVEQIIKNSIYHFISYQTIKDGKLQNFIKKEYDLEKRTPFVGSLQDVKKNYTFMNEKIIIQSLFSHNEKDAYNQISKFRNDIAHTGDVSTMYSEEIFFHAINFVKKLYFNIKLYSFNKRYLNYILIRDKKINSEKNSYKKRKIEDEIFCKYDSIVRKESLEIALLLKEEVI